MQHRIQNNVYFSQVNTIIIDEVDTMLTQGFGRDIRDILRSVLSRRKLENPESEPSVQLIMATATLTKAVKLLLTDVEEGGFNIELAGNDLY
jgi:superfamily II DNA/RNA helicase